MLFSENMNIKEATQTRVLLAELLNCEVDDLQLIEDCRIDFRDIFQYLEDYEETKTLESIFKAMVYLAAYEAFDENKVDSIEDAIAILDIEYNGIASTIHLVEGYSLQDWEVEDFETLTGRSILY